MVLTTPLWCSAHHEGVLVLTMLRWVVEQWTGKACEADGIKFELREVEKMDLEVRSCPLPPPHDIAPLPNVE